ncbi:Smc hinge domain-containing protein [Backusella circina FSU 941]|nr:Smc hinge domain-containing protein [Backusella circina FSU 941]
MNKEKAGRVTFIPLNRVRTRAYQYPKAANASSRDAIPMMEQIQVDARFQKAFEHIFGGVIVCPNLEVASSYAKSHKLTSVTLDGGRVDSRGALSGGFTDHRHSRLDAAKRLKQAQLKITEQRQRKEQIKEELIVVDQQVTAIINKVQELEAQKRKTDVVDDFRSVESKLRNEEGSLKTTIELKARQLENVRTGGQLLERQLIAYQSEVASEMSSVLSPEEESRLGHISGTIEQLKQSLKDTFKTRTEVNR